MTRLVDAVQRGLGNVAKKGTFKMVIVRHVIVEAEVLFLTRSQDYVTVARQEALEPLEMLAVVAELN